MQAICGYARAVLIARWRMRWSSDAAGTGGSAMKLPLRQAKSRKGGWMNWNLLQRVKREAEEDWGRKRRTWPLQRTWRVSRDLKGLDIRKGLDMQSAQTFCAVVFGALGVLMILVARYEKASHDIRKILIISWMSKHTIGLLLMIIAALIFLSQFITR
jgi:hypothetical protein